MAKIRKTWYLWSDTTYNDIMQMGLYVDQLGDTDTNESFIYIYAIIKNLTDEPIVINNTRFNTTLDGTTSSNDWITNTTIQPNSYKLFGFAPMAFDNIEHDEYGTKTVSITSQIKTHYFPDDHTTINLTLNLSTLLDLERIDISNVVFTELKDIDKEALNTGYATIKTKVIVLPDPEHSERLILTESDAVKEWSIVDERYVPDSGFIGQFVARTLDGVLQNISEEFNIENREVNVQMGIVQMGSDIENLVSESGLILTTEDNEKVANRTFDDDIVTWYSLGNFLITKPESDEVVDNTKYEGFDYTVKFNIPFDADWHKFGTQDSFNDILNSGRSVTALELTQYVCDQVGVELGNNRFSNYDFPIKSNQFTEGNTCRDVLKAISQLAYGWCRIGWDNKLYIDEPNQDTSNMSIYNSLTNDNYYSLTVQKNVYGPVNRVVVGMSDIDGEGVYVENPESIEENGLHELYVYDNPITYTIDLRNLALNYAPNLFGLSYTPFESETPGHPWLKANEIIKIVDMYGTEKYAYPFNNTIKYTGHIRTKLSAPSPTEQEITTSYDKTIYKTLRKVGIQVDKQEGLITIMNSKLETTSDGLSSLETKFEQEITNTYSKQQIQEIISGTAEDGTVVSSVKTTSGLFDKDGLTIEQEGRTNTKTNINSNGMIIYNKNSSIDDPLLTVNSDGVIGKNIKVSTYLNIGSHSRIEDYTHTDGSIGTGVFWIGGGF